MVKCSPHRPKDLAGHVIPAAVFASSRPAGARSAARPQESDPRSADPPVATGTEPAKQTRHKPLDPGKRFCLRQMPRRCSSEPANGTADPSADSLAPGGVRTPQDLTVNRCQRHACLASGAVSRVQNFAGECPTNAEDVDVQALGRIKLGDPLVLGDRLRRVLPAAHYGWIARASVPAVRHLRNSTRHASGKSGLRGSRHEGVPVQYPRTPSVTSRRRSRSKFS